MVFSRAIATFHFVPLQVSFQLVIESDSPDTARSAPLKSVSGVVADKTNNR
jgi:hypothetical protein